MSGLTLTPVGQLNAYGLADDPNTYGGLVVSDGGAHITVYLTTLASSVEGFLQSFAPGESVSFAATPHSREFVGALQDKVETEWTLLDDEGIDVVGFGPDIQHGVLDIRVENLTPTDTVTLDTMFGAGNIDVVNVTPSDRPTFDSLTTTRVEDTSPFNGGDSITNHSGDCSTGFGITISGTTDLLTAGHCFAVGTDVYNGRELHTIRASGKGDINGLIGAVSERSFGATKGTSEVINGRGSDLIWTGSIGSPQRATVSGIENNPIGDQVCQSGAYSGETCGLVIEGNNTCTTIEGIKLCHLIHAYSPSGGIATQGGDSGGPVFRFVSTRLYGTGTVVAGNTTKSGGHTTTCTYFKTLGGCSTNIWYTALDWTITHWGASLNT